MYINIPHTPNICNNCLICWQIINTNQDQDIFSKSGGIFQHCWWQHPISYFGVQQKGSQFCHSSWFKKLPTANSRSELLHLQSEALHVLLGQFFSCYKPTELHWRQLGFVKVHELREDVFVFHCPLNLPLRLIQSLQLKGKMEHSPQLELYPGMEQVEQVGWMPLTAIPPLLKSLWGKAEVNTRSGEPVPTSHANVLA